MQLDLKTIIIIVVIVGFVLSVNFTLIGLLRGDKRVRAEASKWGLAVGGGRQAQANANAQAEALHAAVAALQATPVPTDPTPHE